MSSKRRSTSKDAGDKVKRSRQETSTSEVKDKPESDNVASIEHFNFDVEAIPCAFTELEKAYGQEVHMFIHTHMRGYDKNGDGKNMDTSYYDKYGAPVMEEDSWSEGYHSVELEIRKHFTHCLDPEVDFPLIGAMSGGTHLYKAHHNNKPYNWTGWVPLKKRWLCNNKFFHNRDILTLRGNEIQNNLWDYDPYYEAMDDDDGVPIQNQPQDHYRGGYWYPGDPFGRYLHIMALKSHHEKETKRYNFIVHPLAYRRTLNTVPDNSVDAMQWCYLNAEEEEHFTNPKKNWGEKIYGAEIFNDFSYFYSWTCVSDENIHNGDMMNYNTPEKGRYIYWFDTYPLEFAEFLIDTALKMGVYMQILSANDAFYSRSVLPPNHPADDKGIKEAHLVSDPKGALVTTAAPIHEHQDSSVHCKKMKRLHTMNAKSKQFIDSRPYRGNTVFGYTTLVDPLKEIRTKIINEDDLEGSETLAITYLQEGRFYAHTGVYNLFEYDQKTQVIPIMILGQKNPDKLCYDMTEVNGDGKLVFNFLPSTHADHLIWRYTIESLTGNQNIESVQGYFMLDESKTTELDLSNYDQKKMKFIRFTSFKNDNPQRRAWFCAIRGLEFGALRKNSELPEMKYRVATVEENKEMGSGLKKFLRETGTFAQDVVESKDLDFMIEKCTSEEEDNFYAYSLQVCPLQQDPKAESTKSNQPPPKRYLQSVHGYFRLNESFPTRLSLGNSWDKSTVKDNKIFFHAINTKTGAPKSMFPTLLPKCR